MSRRKNRNRSPSTAKTACVISEQDDVTKDNQAALKVVEPALSADLSTEQYLNLRKEVQEVDKNNSDQHDKAILQLATGTLALSVTFLEKIAPNPLPESLWVIATGWSALIVCIISMLLSFVFGQLACKSQLEIYDEMYENQVNVTRPPKWTRWTTSANLISFASFVVGIFFILGFSWYNLISKPHLSDQTQTSENQHAMPSQNELPSVPTKLQAVREPDLRTGYNPPVPPKIIVNPPKPNPPTPKK